MPSPGLREKQVYSLLSKTVVSNKEYRSLLESLHQYTARHNCLISQVRVDHHVFWTVSLGIIRVDRAFFIHSSKCQLFLRGLQHVRLKIYSVIFCFDELTLLPRRRTTQCCATMQSTSVAIKYRVVNPCIFLPLYSPPLSPITLYETKKR